MSKEKINILKKNIENLFEKVKEEKNTNPDIISWYNRLDVLQYKINKQNINKEDYDYIENELKSITSEYINYCDYIENELKYITELQNERGWLSIFLIIFVFLIFIMFIYIYTN